MKVINLGLIALLLSTTVHAHHARFGFFSATESVDIKGVVTELKWSNPHVRIEIAVTNSDGEVENWHAELAALSSFRNRGITEAFIEVGESVELFGRASSKGLSELSPTNLLREDGTEVILAFNSPPYYSARSTAQFVDPKASEQSQQLARESADGIFRVWSTQPSTRAFTAYYGDFPLTEAAAAAKAQFDSASEDLLRCWEKGMPLLMVTPHPMEFSRQDDDILLRYEEDDAMRIIHMGESDPNATASALGYSTGTWNGDTLVVATSKLNSPIFDDVGTPLSSDAQLIERFTLSDDEQRLDYQITITDPATFSQPVELSRHWIWRPERALQTWNCQN